MVGGHSWHIYLDFCPLQFLLTIHHHHREVNFPEHRLGALLDTHNKKDRIFSLLNSFHSK